MRAKTSQRTKVSEADYGGWNVRSYLDFARYRSKIEANLALILVSCFIALVCTHMQYNKIEESHANA